MLKILFVFISALLIITILTGKYYLFNCKRPVILSRCGFIMAILFSMYSILAFILLIAAGDITYKLILFLLAISPFVVGKLTKYENLNIATNLQIMFLIIGILYIFEQ